MDSCGSQTPGWPPGNKFGLDSDPGAVGGLIFRGWMGRLVAGLTSLSLLMGCGPTIKFGSPPKIDRLGTLKPGISSMADVSVALGEPRGHGAARLSDSPEPRTIWFYEYVEAEGSRAALKMLLVFFNQQQYDGHLWFSSAQLIQQEN